MTETSTRIANYIFETFAEPITRNRFGTVYKGRDLKNRRDVSVLVIPVTKMKKGFSTSEFQKKVEFLKEIRGPNVVQIYDIILVPSPGYIYIFTEACHHREVGILLEKTKTIPEEHALRLVKQIGYAFKLIKELASQTAGHKYSVLLQNHKQLSPSSIFLHGGRVKISESGIFALLEEVLDIQDYPDLFEASHYEAPEVHQQTDTICLAKADVWSLGVITYQCLFGELPFIGDTIQEQHNYFVRNGLTFPDEVRRETKDLLKKMLAFNPVNRISWSEILAHPSLKHALVKIREGERRSLKDSEATLITALENTFNEIEDPSILLCPHSKPAHVKIVEKDMLREEFQPSKEAEEDPMTQKHQNSVEEQQRQDSGKGDYAFEIETQKGPEETNKQNEQLISEKPSKGKKKKEKKAKKEKKPKKVKAEKVKTPKKKTEDAEYVRMKRKQKDLTKACNIF